ncbi:diiron oxygenase [Paraherbaspirillum soli]|uniref:Diiron oxygenase n=1 Tax=Paraherbaspirillum soli TaxID=631222 RepID=A0ABW0M9B7_9BURK
MIRFRPSVSLATSLIGILDIMIAFNDDVSTLSNDVSRSKRMLSAFAKTWPNRARVKKEELVPIFEENKEDFLEELLPFKDQARYLSASKEMKSKVLTCGWIMYNAKTVQIETEIVAPACSDITAGRLPGLDDPEAQLAASETMVDEAYHLHLVEEANRLTKRWRGMDTLHVPQFHLVGYMKQMQAQMEHAWQRQMIQFCTAVVSEIFISDYLHLLSENQEIQSFNRQTVEAHRHDEMSHSPLFRSFGKLYFYNLTEAQQAFCADILPRPVVWFADRELDVWLSLLQQINFPDAEAMIQECRDQHEVDLAALDYAGIVSLASEIGMLDTKVGRDSFAKQGLLG